MTASRIGRVEADFPEHPQDEFELLEEMSVDDRLPEATEPEAPANWRDVTVGYESHEPRHRRTRLDEVIDYSLRDYDIIRGAKKAISDIDTWHNELDELQAVEEQKIEEANARADESDPELEQLFEGLVFEELSPPERHLRATQWIRLYESLEDDGRSLAAYETLRQPVPDIMLLTQSLTTNRRLATYKLYVTDIATPELGLEGGQLQIKFMATAYDELVLRSELDSVKSQSVAEADSTDREPQTSVPEATQMAFPIARLADYVVVGPQAIGDHILSQLNDEDMTQNLDDILGAQDIISEIGLGASQPELIEALEQKAWDYFNSQLGLDEADRGLPARDIDGVIFRAVDRVGGELQLINSYPELVSVVERIETAIAAKIGETDWRLGRKGQLAGIVLVTNGQLETSRAVMLGRREIHDALSLLQSKYGEAVVPAELLIDTAVPEADDDEPEESYESRLPLIQPASPRKMSATRRLAKKILRS